MKPATRLSAETMGGNQTITLKVQGGIMRRGRPEGNCSHILILNVGSVKPPTNKKM